MLGELAGFAASRFRQGQRDRAGEIAVSSVTGALQRDIGRHGIGQQAAFKEGLEGVGDEVLQVRFQGKTFRMGLPIS